MLYILLVSYLVLGYLFYLHVEGFGKPKNPKKRALFYFLGFPGLLLEKAKKFSEHFVSVSLHEKIVNWFFK